jgi:hypothetical protein
MIRRASAFSGREACSPVVHLARHQSSAREFADAHFIHNG